MGPVTVAASPEAAAQCAAGRIASHLRATVDRRGAALVALTGGQSILPVYATLLDPAAPWARTVPWSRVHVCWTDERCVPPTHQDSNYGAARAGLLAHIPIPDASIHRIEGERAPEDAARTYDQALRQVQQTLGRQGDDLFDLVLMSLGTDAHIASLFPGQPVPVPGRLAAVSRPLHLPHARITLTRDALAASCLILVVAIGAARAAALAATFAGGGDAEQTPARLLRGLGAPVEWITDAAAARATPGLSG